MKEKRLKKPGKLLAAPRQRKRKALSGWRNGVAGSAGSENNQPIMMSANNENQ
jgi:hypothetical protein